MSKFKAVAVHFALSFSIVAIVLFVIFTQWYPPPYFQVNGAQSVLRTLIGVDLVLGPLLTAILYRPNKPGLKFDMSFVALVQLSALIYGTSVLYQERPQFLVFAVDRYVVLPERDVIDTSGTNVDAACQNTPSNPCVAVAVIPQDPEVRSELTIDVLQTGIDIERRANLWVSLDEGVSRVLERAKPLSALEKFDPALAETAAQLRDTHSKAGAPLLLVPIVNKRLESMYAVINGSNAALLDVIEADPWALFSEPEAAPNEGEKSVGPAG